MTDAELVKRMAERDEIALSLLQRKYNTYCQSIAVKLLGNEQEAQEVVNDAWLQVWERVAKAPPENFKQYLAKTVRNTALHCIEFRSARKRSGICVQLDELGECIPDRLSGCDVEMMALRDALNRFVRGLKPEYRQIFVNRYWYGDSIRDLAKDFSCTENRVGVILCRCRKQLRKYLEKEDIWL